jgi:hypothetical protein
MNRLEKVEYLIIHHTSRNNDFPFFVRLRHKYLRGWDDIGYHYLIGGTGFFTKNGRIYPGRPEGMKGAHTFGYNRRSLGICLIGNFEKTAPSKEQFESLFSLLEQKAKQYSVPIEKILGHGELPGADTACPGKWVDMDYIREMIHIRSFISLPVKVLEHA